VDAELELWAAANMLIRRYGTKARAHAAIRAEELLRQGDTRGQAKFSAIEHRIKALDAPSADEPN
jgi:triphosphoribosyl-dephospho-CoA synthetase